MRQAEKERKKFYSRIPFILDQDKKIPKKIAKKIEKIKKTSFRHYFFTKQDEIGREGEKKKIYFRIPFMLDRGKEIPKKIAKKLKKFKNLFPTLFLAKTG